MEGFWFDPPPLPLPPQIHSKFQFLWRISFQIFFDTPGYLCLHTITQTCAQGAFKLQLVAAQAQQKSQWKSQ